MFLSGGELNADFGEMQNLETASAGWSKASIKRECFLR